MVRAIVADEVRKVVAELPAAAAGPKGEDGKDAPPIDFAQVVNEVIAHLPAPRDGAPGKDADPGAIRELVFAEVERAVGEIPKPKDGLPGTPGKDAEPIHPDTVQLMVSRMVVDEVARAVNAIPRPRDGSNGRDGRDGTPGQDALQIDPLPGIEDGKTYLRGTWACHKGGLARFDGQQWRCVMRGIHYETDVLSDDGRTRTRKTFYSDDTSAEFVSHSPAMLYREVFRDGTDYTRGDCVTYDGSVWICVVDVAKAKPGTTPDWKLAVRRGGEGKPGKDGLKGLDGKDGKDWRPIGVNR